MHGDPFHSRDGVCLYGPGNYTSNSAHPPLWGFSLDGYNIYGRHLSANNEGYSMALDDCGGHTHGAYGYHYHSQVITAYASTGAQRGVTTGAAYAVFPPGVFKCWRVHAAAPSAEHTQSLKRASTHTHSRPRLPRYKPILSCIHCPRKRTFMRAHRHSYTPHFHAETTDALTRASTCTPYASTLTGLTSERRTLNRLSSLLFYTRLFFRAT